MQHLHRHYPQWAILAAVAVALVCPTCSVVPNQAAAEADPLTHYADYGAAFLSHIASNAWNTNATAPLKQVTSGVLG